MMLFFDPCGPMVHYYFGVRPFKGLLRIRDLNPEANLEWRMSRWEMLVFGLRCILVAVRLGK